MKIELWEIPKGMATTLECGHRIEVSEESGGYDEQSWAPSYEQLETHLRFRARMHQTLGCA